MGCSRETPMPPEVDGVYGRLVEAREDYEAGVRLVVAGDDVAGENLIAAASTRMLVAARECARTPGCDTDLLAASARELAVDLQAELAADHAAGAADPTSEDAVAGAERPPDDDASDEPAEPRPATAPFSGMDDAQLEARIPMNTRVEAQLNAWLTWKRPDLIEAQRNYRFLRNRVLPAYDEARLPEALLFGMMATESGAKVHAYSRAGAAGPLQFMPATARRYGLGSVDGFDSRLDPFLATRANARYLRDHLEEFGGDLSLTLAAYNGGESRMRRLVRHNPDTAFWDAPLYYALPLETRTYVPRVLAATWLYLHAEDYGLGLERDESTVTAVKLPVSASLGEIAVCLGNAPGEDGWFRTLRNLNPAISPSSRIPAGTRIDLPTALVSDFAESCAGGGALMEIARALHDADYPERPDVIPYTVRRGDSLAVIALEHRSSVRELAALNGIRAPQYVIHPGQTLNVPARQ